MLIRIATHNDVELLCKLQTDFHAYNANQQPLFSAKVEEDGNYPKNSIESATDDLIVAVQDDKIVGFVHVLELNTPPYPIVTPHRYAEITKTFLLTWNIAARVLAKNCWLIQKSVLHKEVWNILN